MMRTETEIEELRADAEDRVAHGTEWPGMSYEEGVRDTLAWLVGDRDESPLDDE